MQEDSGYAIVPLLKKKKINFIVLSGINDDHAKIEAERQGALTFIVKPAEYAHLSEIILLIHKIKNTSIKKSKKKLAINKIEEHPIIAFIMAIILGASSSWIVFTNVWLDPIKFELNQKEKVIKINQETIKDLSNRLSKYEKIKNP